MMRLTPFCLLAAATSLTAFAGTFEELTLKYKPLPTVAEKDLPPLKNQPEPFAGVLRHSGFEAHTWVRFPFVENPGSFAFDPKGRLYVAEANRFWQGTPDLRGANALIRGDFQSRTVEDRAKLYETFASEFPSTFFTNTSDRVIRLEDRDGNGAADHRTVFAGGFNAPLDGIGFSLLAEDDAVYYTCIPNLWKLTDADGDGVAETRQPLITGFGVRVSFIGHDLHGIIRGPDGRLYFSVGDRGFHIKTSDGRVLSKPGLGAILRCESDGSGLEEFCKGLRNPQELGFDEAGNLFTFDNNADIGDRARMVYALEGSDSGWNMAHQSAHHYVKALDWGEFHPEISMWVAEKMFETFTEEQPQWVYPPAAHVARGPSGFAWLSGDSLPADLRGKFLLANYLGAAQSCNVLAIGLKPKGAGYTAASEDIFAEGADITDVELGYDGNIYLCDFGGGWSLNTRGAIDVLRPKDPAQKQAGAEAQAIFAKGLKGESQERLLALLESADKRLRQSAQFELARRGQKDALAALASDASKPVTTRLHGIWGLDQLGRSGAAVVPALLALGADSEPEIRANAARALGSLRAPESRELLLAMLGDASPRARSLAAIALGRVAKPGDPEGIAALYAMAARNLESGQIDPVLRHAALSAIGQIGTIESAVERRSSKDRETRLLALLYLRRQESAAAAGFLDDADPLIRIEAIRTVYDTAAVDGSAGDTIAALASRAAELPATVQRRIVAANYRRGTDGNARNLVLMAGDGSLAVSTRSAALAALSLWQNPITTDPVSGDYRPIPKSERRMLELGQAIDGGLRQLFALELPPQLASQALSLADQANVRLENATLQGFVDNARLAPGVRVAALESLLRAAPGQAAAILAPLLESPEPALAAAALRSGFALKLDGLAAIARKAIQTGPLEKAREAVAGLVAAQPAELAAELAALWKERQNNGLRRELWLDLFLALQSSKDTQSLAAEFAATAKDAVFNLSQTGGDIRLGEQVFRNQGGCMQCHKMGDAGGIQGPPLTLVGERLAPAKLVESLIDPNAEIAEGYGLASISLSDGSLLMGRIAKQSEQELEVVGIDGKPVTVARSKVASIAPPVSAMPPLGISLPPRDLRDLIAYLTTRDAAHMDRQTGGSASHGEAQQEKVAK